MNEDDQVITQENIKERRWRKKKFGKVNFDFYDASCTNIRLCDFKGFSSVQADFSDAIFENNTAPAADFSGSNFSNASLTDSILNRSSFKSANLTRANFDCSDLRGVDFNGAVVVNASFCDADLSGADFTGARIENADFHGAKLDGALFDVDFYGSQKNNDMFYAPEAVEDFTAIAKPVANNIVKTLCDKNLLDEAEANVDMDRLLDALSPKKKSDKNHHQLDEKINKIMGHVASANVGSLLNSLQQCDGEPPVAVKNMIEGMMADYDLAEDATTEDLLLSMLSGMKKK